MMTRVIRIHYDLGLALVLVLALGLALVHLVL